MSTEQRYRFVDKTGHCFKDFQDKDPEMNYLTGAMLRASHEKGKAFGVGDMMVFRDELIEAGFQWGKDFYVVKV